MKKIILVFAIIMSPFSANSQEKDLKSILISTAWKIDVEAIKANALKKIDSLAEMKDLSPEEKEIAIVSAFTGVKKIRFVFEDNNYFKQTITDEIKYEGTFTVDLNKNQLITNLEIEPNCIYTIISYDESKIILHHIERDNDLILIKAKL